MTGSLILLIFEQMQGNKNAGFPLYFFILCNTCTGIDGVSTALDIRQFYISDTLCFK